MPEAPTASQPDCGDVFQWLELASIHHADKLAVVDRGRDATSTYSQLHRESAALAFWLDKQGIGRGDAIAVHCRNSAAVMRIHFAAAALPAQSWAQARRQLSCLQIGLCIVSKDAGCVRN